MGFTGQRSFCLDTDMISRLFYDDTLAPDSSVTLSQQASHHLTKVLRARVGDQVILFNGDGNEYAATLETVDSRRTQVSVKDMKSCHNESPLHITLLQGLSRNDRMDTTLQKATELGVNHIVPVICRRSSFKMDAARIEKKMGHWRQVIISACEQSGRCIVPELSTPTAFDDALDARGIADCRIIMAPGADTPVTHLASVDERISLLVGPESGFDEDEVNRSVELGYQPFTLGPRVLRTETAGPAAIAAIQTLWGDFSE